MAGKRTGSDFRQARLNVITHAEALHFPEHPGHGRTMVNQLWGHVLPLRDSSEDDPLLYAYLCADQLPYIASFVIQLQKWVTAVLEATPDQLTETGAQPVCHSMT